MFQKVPIPDYSNAGEKARLHLSLYIFNDPVHVGIHQTVGVLIFAVFKLRIEEKERRKEGTNAQAQTKAAEPRDALSAFTFTLLLSSPSPSQLSILTSLFCHSSSNLSLCLPPLPLLLSLAPLLPLSSRSCPLQRPTLARQGWLQICSSVPRG